MHIRRARRARRTRRGSDVSSQNLPSSPRYCAPTTGLTLGFVSALDGEERTSHPTAAVAMPTPPAMKPIVEIVAAVRPLSTSFFAFVGQLVPLHSSFTVLDLPSAMTPATLPTPRPTTPRPSPIHVTGLIPP